MTLLRMKELRAMSDEELRAKVAQVENDLLRERGIAAMGGAPPSPGRMRALRTNVARALTVMSERAIIARAAAAAKPTTVAAKPAPVAPKRASVIPKRAAPKAA
jgi:large subunit ribosomal protein L29